MVNSEYPNGDKGGNAEELKNHYSVNNYHSLWDSALYEFHDAMKLPFTDTTWASLELNAAYLTNSHTITSAEYRNFNYKKWAADSYELAKNNVYPGLTHGKD